MTGIFDSFKKNRAVYSEDYIKPDNPDANYNYTYGKRIYEERFGNLVGSQISEISKNIVKIFPQSEVGDPTDVSRWIGNMGNWYQHIDEQCEQFIKNERKVIPSKELISDEEFRGFFIEYLEEYNLYTNKPTRLIELNKTSP